jgi:hypothetical protein
VSYVLSILSLTVFLRATGDVALSFALAIVVAGAVQVVTHLTTTNPHWKLAIASTRQSTLRFIGILASTPHLLAAPHGIADSPFRPRL